MTVSDSALLACVRKELLLLWRDLHGLAVLFIMPLAFVLIMSLALQNQFAGQAGTRLRVLVTDGDNSAASRDLLKSLDNGAAFTLITLASAPDNATLNRQLSTGEYAFALAIAPGFGSNLLVDSVNLASATDNGVRLHVYVAPDTSRQIEIIFVSNLRAALGRARMSAVLGGSSIAESLPAGASDMTDPGIRLHYAYQAGRTDEARPTAVQQSVPAWLVFGAFFVVIPLSNTFIRERQQGMLRRLRSTNLGSLTQLAGKLIPYFGVNQLQVVLMLLAGRFLVPLLGGEALRINGPWWLLGIMSSSLSVAALGLSMVVAVSARTTEQATLVSGTGNIILAALGGIMIPKFVMPVAMQRIASLSPMSWGLEGFLDILLRRGGLHEIAPEAAGLTSLGIASILLAWVIHINSRD